MRSSLYVVNKDISYNGNERFGGNHTQDLYCIFFLSYGSIRMQIGEIIENFVGPCVFCFKDGVRYTLLSAKPFYAQSIFFKVSFLNYKITTKMVASGEYARHIRDFGFIPLNMFYEPFTLLPLKKEGIETFHSWFSAVNEALAAENDWRWSCKARLQLNQILEFLFETYLLSYPDNVEDGQDKNALLHHVLYYIHANYNRRLTVGGIAKQFYLNKTTLNELFRKTLNTSVMDYILQYRLQSACHSLATTNLKVYEIAAKNGFRSLSNFSSQFKQKKGLSPTAYREAVIKKRNREIPDKK